MPIRPEVALAATFEPVEFSWSADDVIRYHLALGAGSPVCDGPELRYVYEAGLQVLPTFAVVPASAASAIAARAPGLDYDPHRVLHGEHEVEVFGVLPTAGQSVNRARISAVQDKGHSALVDIAVDTELAGGGLLARNTFRLLLPGEGGFGGIAQRGGDIPPLEVEPDATFLLPTLPQQAALYRMTGDRNPMHIDPEVARAAGLDAPTLPGLCTWAMVAKALVDRELDGIATRMRGFAARFSGPVYPGETLEVSLWRGSDEHAVEATVIERGRPALARGRFRFQA